MSETTRNTTIAARTAETVAMWGGSIRSAGLDSIVAGVPCVRVGKVAVPVLGAGDIKVFDRVPFTIRIDNDEDRKVTRVSLVPVEDDEKVGMPVYGPDQKGRLATELEAATRIGYAALHGLISEGNGERNPFQLSVVDETGEVYDLPYGDIEASTLMAAVKIAAQMRLDALATAAQPS